MKSMRTLLAAGAASLALGFAAPAFAEPAMWVVKDQDSTITLFGSVHVLPKDAQWRTARFDSAFSSAEEVWFEIDLSPASQQAAQGLALKLGMSPDRPLSSVLTPVERARVKAAADKLGLPDAQLEGMRPWLVGLTFSMVALAKAGFDPNSGVEKTLAAEVGTRPAKSFETAEQQIGFFADLPDAAQRAFLMNTLDDLDRGPTMFAEMVSDWSAGDVKGLESVFLAEMRRNYADLYDVLIKRRNEAWAERIIQELAGSGTDFITVGAGHLVGPDSVQALLKARGVKVERVRASGSRR